MKWEVTEGTSYKYIPLSGAFCHSESTTDIHCQFGVPATHSIATAPIVWTPIQPPISLTFQC
jgi:hypothetical protein